MQQFYEWDSWDLNQFLDMKFDRCDIWHMTKQKTPVKKKFLQNNDLLFVWNANLVIYKVMQIWIKNSYGFFFVNFRLFRHLTDATFATVLWIRQLTNKIIYMYEIWQMRHMMHATYDIWHKKHFLQKYDFLFV